MYSKEQIINAVKMELIEANKIFGKKKKLYSKDYTIIGVVISALEKIK